MKFIDDSSVRRLVQYANHAEAGHLPLAGGMLDQTPAFVAGLAMVRAERASYGGSD